MGQRLDLELALKALNLLHIGQHATLRVVIGKVVNSERVQMESCESDELPAKPELSELSDIFTDFLVAHTLAVPVVLV